MHEPSGRSFGMGLGRFAVVIGVLFLGLGFAALFAGQRMEGVDCLVLGGLSLLAGCAILYRRRREARGKEAAPGPAESVPPADQPRP
jgi:hypothetical protein